MTVEMLENELKNGKLSNLYLLHGEETFLIESTLKKIKKLFGEILQGINYIQIDETNIETLMDNINMPAFGFDKKLIIVKNVGAAISRPQKSKLESNITEELIEYLKEENTTNVIVFVENGVGAGLVPVRINI